jgi:hypothetical protein
VLGDEACPVAEADALQPRAREASIENRSPLDDLIAKGCGQFSRRVSGCLFAGTIAIDDVTDDGPRSDETDVVVARRTRSGPAYRWRSKASSKRQSRAKLASA